jgi:hypothetical protein
VVRLPARKSIKNPLFGSGFQCYLYTLLHRRANRKERIITTSTSIDREVLEQMAAKAVCAYQYYDLMDCLDSTSDEELLAIIEGRYPCDCDDCEATRATVGDKSDEQSKI